MIVIYHDIGGAHSAATAANLHVNVLSPNKIPTKEDLQNLPTFDKIQKKYIGHLIYIGKDEFNASVYTLSRQRSEKIVIPAIKDIYRISNGSLDGLYLVDTSPSVNMLMKIGGALSRRFKCVSVGRPIVTYGTQKAFKEITSIVSNIKDQIQKDLKAKH